MSDLADRFERARRSQPPLPASGETAARFRWLFDHARSDLSLGRLLEADADARAIAADVGAHLEDPTKSYGVWAAAGGTLSVRCCGDGRVMVSGVQPWAGGAGIVDRSLVMIRTDASSMLVDLPVDRSSVDLSSWRTPVLASTTTGAATFRAAIGRRICDGDDYLERAGFWHGAIGVAACWAGAAAGLLDAHTARWSRRDPHSLASLGAAYAEVSCAEALVMSAAGRIDDSVARDRRAAEILARSVRYVVDTACRRVIDHLSVGAGPLPLSGDDEVVRRTGELQLTIRQSHGLRDVEPIGSRLTVSPATNSSLPRSRSAAI